MEVIRVKQTFIDNRLRVELVVTTDKKVAATDVFSVLYSDKEYYFAVQSVETDSGNLLVCYLVETGYWANGFGRSNPDIDIRELVGSRLQFARLSQDDAKKIRHEECWC